MSLAVHHFPGKHISAGHVLCVDRQGLRVLRHAAAFGVIGGSMASQAAAFGLRCYRPRRKIPRRRRDPDFCLVPEPLLVEVDAVDTAVTLQKPLNSPIRFFPSTHAPPEGKSSQK